MTGFGSGEALGDELRLVMEVRTLNNRGRDLHIRLPRGYMALEPALRSMLQERIRRGRVDLHLNIVEAPPPDSRVRVNQELAQRCKEALDDLTEALGMDAPPSMDQLLRMSEVVEVIAPPPDADALLPHVQRATSEALDGLIRAREAEGARLEKDLLERLESIEARVAQVDLRVPGLAQDALERLRSHIERLVGNLKLDPGRLEQEAALLAEKGDVSEELVRLRSHIARFRELLGAPEPRPVGRELEFLVQELVRESNTLGSKLSDPDCSRLALEIKAEVNRLREQVLNIE